MQAAIPHSSLARPLGMLRTGIVLHRVTHPWPHPGCITGNYTSTRMGLNMTEAFRFEKLHKCPPELQWQTHKWKRLFSTPVSHMGGTS